MKTISIILVLNMIMIQAITAQSKAEKEVTTAVEALRMAMILGTKEPLDAITSAELTYGHSSGKIEKKADFIDSFVSGRTDFVTIEFTEQTIQIFDKTAIVRNKLSAQTNDNGKPGSVNLALLLVFQKQNKKWLLIARQAVRLS